MPDPRPSQASTIAIAMICSGLVTAQFIGGKAVRDALFLAQLDVTTLPTMVMLASGVAFVLAAASSRSLRVLSPALVVPLTFVVSGVLLLVEWTLTASRPTLAAVLVYLHIAGLGPILGSGFWLITSEQFDPRTAKRRYSHIALAGTLGGLLGGAIAERLGAWFGLTSVLPFLAVLNLVGAIGVRHLATVAAGVRMEDLMAAERRIAEPSVSALQVMKRLPYVRTLAALVLFGTMSAALVDYVFKAEAVSTFGRGEMLLRFFAIYYAAISVLTFVIQLSASQILLQRLGLAFATSLPSAAVFIGSLLTLVFPGFRSILLTRGGESVLNGSLYRLGYEIFYTPIPPNEKRAVKSLIDVGVDRLGDAAGAAFIAVVLAVLPAGEHREILYLSVAVSTVGMFLASSLKRGYIQTLENSLRNRALDLELGEVSDHTTRTALLRTLGHLPSHPFTPSPRHNPAHSPSPSGRTDRLDAEMHQIVALRSRDAEKVSEILRRDTSLSASLVPHVIPLLAWNRVSADAVFALRKVAEERVGQFIDALVDPSQDFAVKRRLARVMAICVSQRAADGLLLGLEDARFEVRFQCGRALAAIHQTNPRVQIRQDDVVEVVLREMAVSRSVWESRRLLDALDSPDDVSFVDKFVRDRAGQSLAHVFTLLSLVLPTEPLQIAFSGLHAGDQQLRGTALEYLEAVLPGRVRDRLWPFLEDDRPSASRIARPRNEILDDLLRSNHSIQVNIEELRRRHSKA